MGLSKSTGKNIFSFFVGLVFSLSILYFIAQTWKAIAEMVGTQYQLIWLFLWSGTIIAFIYMARSISYYLLTTPQPLQFAGITLPNKFFDLDAREKLHKVDEEIIKEYDELKLELNEARSLLDEYIVENQSNSEIIAELANLSDIFVRHHVNASRLTRSLVQLWKEGLEGKETWLWEFCNNVLDECVTTLTQDRADKSSSIFFINGNDLHMFAYNRIEATSSRSRRFKRGMGFAGSIWEKNSEEIVNDITGDSRWNGEYAPNHSYSSILGYPIRIGVNKEVVGVLCIQSEAEGGFTEKDFVMVDFYAHICGLAKLCDNIIDERR